MRSTEGLRSMEERIIRAVLMPQLYLPPRRGVRQSLAPMARVVWHNTRREEWTHMDNSAANPWHVPRRERWMLPGPERWDMYKNIRHRVPVRGSK